MEWTDLEVALLTQALPVLIYLLAPCLVFSLLIYAINRITGPAQPQGVALGACLYYEGVTMHNSTQYAMGAEDGRNSPGDLVRFSLLPEAVYADMPAEQMAAYDTPMARLAPELERNIAQLLAELEAHRGH